MVTDLALLDAGDLAAGVAPPSNTDAAREEYPEEEKLPIVEDVLTDEREVCLPTPMGGPAAPSRDKLLTLLLVLMPDIPLML